jgi:hypothetical protein
MLKSSRLRTVGSAGVGGLSLLVGGVNAMGLNMRASLRADIEARRMRVANMLLARRSQRSMAADLKVSLATVSADTKAVRAEWQAQRLRAFGEHVAEELAHLEAAEAAIWLKVTGGEIEATHALLAIQSRRAKLLGLDAPTKATLDGGLVVTWVGASPDDI